MIKKFFLLIALILYASVSFAADGVVVSVKKAERQSISVSHEYTGTIQSLQTVDVRPELSARVSRVHFREGSYVKAGQLLFTLDNSQYSATVSLRKAELQNAEANLDKARKYLKRLKAADKRSVPASEMDTAESSVKVAQAVVAQAKASLSLAQIDLNRTRITAPISGRIGKALLTKGNYAGPGSSMAEIIQINPVRAAVDIPYNDYQVIRNENIRSEIHNADISGRIFSGTHEFDDNEVNTATGTVKTYWTFENSDNVLIPGASVHVVLSLREPRSVVLIPQTAKVSGQDGNYVYVVENNTAHRRKVTIEEESGSQIAVIGVNEGEVVVSQGAQKLFDNAPVRIQEQ